MLGELVVSTGEEPHGRGGTHDPDSLDEVVDVPHLVVEQLLLGGHTAREVDGEIEAAFCVAGDLTFLF